MDSDSVCCIGGVCREKLVCRWPWFVLEVAGISAFPCCYYKYQARGCDRSRNEQFADAVCTRLLGAAAHRKLDAIKVGMVPAHSR